MYREMTIYALVILGCTILMKGIGDGTLGMALIFASGILLVCWPRKKRRSEYADPWSDI